MNEWGSNIIMDFNSSQIDFNSWGSYSLKFKIKLN
jgi:hypothetical protein